MDWGDYSDESPFWLKHCEEELIFRLFLSGIHNAVAEGNLDVVRRCIEEKGESVNKQETQFGFTPLHIIAKYGIVDTTEVLDYLLAREDIEVDARCSKGETPLYLATALGHIALVEKLIQAGCDVNIPDNNNDTALHMSVCHPRICRLLVHGARIRTNDSQGRTLHLAVENDCLEIVHMLLYYNVDANIPDTYGHTPFILALDRRNEEAQEALLEYVDDFSSSSYCLDWYGSILCLALRSNSPFVKDIMERGADFTDVDEIFINYNDCLHAAVHLHPVDFTAFKMVWERLPCGKPTVNLLYFLDYIKGQVTFTFLKIVIESDYFEPAVEFFSQEENYFLFVNKFAENKFDLNQLTALTCRLLLYGFRACSNDIDAIFSKYGYCELFRILLHMDNDFTRGWLPRMVLPRLIFDIDYDLKSIVDKVNDIPKGAVLQLLEYYICPRFIDAITLKYRFDESMSSILGRLPKVPSLIELARNAAKEHIRQWFKVASTCQFYTTIDHLPIPTLYKNILSFQKKMYRVK